MIARIVLLVVALVLAPPAMAWGDRGHRLVAEIALANVAPATRSAIGTLVQAEAGLGTPACPVQTLADAAVWPDCLRAEGWRWAYTFPWHFNDGEVTAAAFDPAAHCEYGACAIAQITRNQRLLADARLPAAQRLEALAFLAHIVGDIHQPLHAADHAGDHGGNGVTVANLPGAPYVLPTRPQPTVVSARPVPVSLHWLWDHVLVERAQRAGMLPAAQPYPQDQRQALAAGGPADWAQESWLIARDTVYPQAFGHVLAPGEATPASVTITEAALDADLPVVRGRLLRAGLRLARLLDEALAAS